MITKTKSLKYCPECSKNDGVQSPVKRYKLNDQTYTILCDNELCSFQETHEGIPTLNPEFLVMAGLPEKLLDYMDVYPDDVDKIVRFAAHDYFVKHCTVTAEDMKDFDNSLNQIFEHVHPHNESKSTIQSCEHLGNDIALILGKTKNELHNSTSDIDPEYKKSVTDILKQIDNFTYPDDIFLTE